MAYQRMIQYSDNFGDRESEARAALESLRSQAGFKGGRILPPDSAKPGWKLQAFFDDEPESGWLPDGLRRVMVLDSQRRLLGIS